MPQFRPGSVLTGQAETFDGNKIFNPDLSTAPTDGEVLVYDAANDKWVPGEASSGASRAPRDLVNLQSVTETGGINAGCVVASTSTFSWTAPSDITEVYIEIAGAGAGGETNAAQGGGGSGRGGGAAAYYQAWHTITPGDTFAIVIGNAAGQRSNACGGTQRPGAVSSITGTFDSNAAAVITAGGGIGGGVLAGNVSFSGFGGDTPQLAGEVPQDNPHFHPGLLIWNTDQWRENGDATQNGGRGGRSYRAASGGAGSAGGGGGSGFNSGTAGSGDGSGNPGGAGGIRITWYSATSTAANFPIS